MRNDKDTEKVKSRQGEFRRQQFWNFHKEWSISSSLVLNPKSKRRQVVKISVILSHEMGAQKNPSGEISSNLDLVIYEFLLLFPSPQKKISHGIGAQKNPSGDVSNLDLVI